MTLVPADVIPGIKDWLDPRLGTVEARLNVPEKWTPTAGPVLVVADDGGSALLPISSRHVIRLTAYAPGRTQARSIVALAAAKLVESQPRPAGVTYVDPNVGGILDARDKATGAFLASVLVTVTARTVEAS